MNNYYSIKASQSYENFTSLPQEVLWISTLNYKENWVMEKLGYEKTVLRKVLGTY